MVTPSQVADVEQYIKQFKDPLSTQDELCQSFERAVRWLQTHPPREQVNIVKDTGFGRAFRAFGNRKDLDNVHTERVKAFIKHFALHQGKKGFDRSSGDSHAHARFVPELQVDGEGDGVVAAADVAIEELSEASIHA